MSKLKVSTREIGTVCVFDLQGSPTQETLQEVAWKIQRNIRRHRLQRVILNLQMIPTLDPLGLRKLLAACIRPQKSLIFGASGSLVMILEDTYIPQNVRICPSEKEVAEDFGPFLLEHEKDKEFEAKSVESALGNDVEKRRSKRMHVALPIEIDFEGADGLPIRTRAIATNISEGGLFAEYLDLAVAMKLESLDSELQDKEVAIHIFPSANFPEEYELRGQIKRKELHRKQFGLAVEFLGDLKAS
ncbi:MAG: PilZ domain-containing protein [Candidatus Omnitrophota bacterium]|nr:PilZ domain-containing protein [Candidatus Omnitrophota bacterium]